MKRATILILVVCCTLGMGEYFDTLFDVLKELFEEYEGTSGIFNEIFKRIIEFVPLLVIDPKTFSDVFKHGPPIYKRALLPFQWSSQETIGEYYDFIIVGSSAAGSILASRLSENTEHEILLLEIGTEENELNQIPMLTGLNQMTPYNWQHVMEFQENFALGHERNLLAWNRGRALGGSTVINYMVYSRGNPAEYDKWASDGNAGWSYEEVLPYFLKTERSNNLRASEPLFHNSSGLLSVENSFQSPILEAFIQGGIDLGYDLIDYNGERQIGFAPVQGILKRGRRCSAGRAFLEPVKDRSNLHIHTGVLVTEVLISNKTAYGVKYRKNGILHVVKATKEVILSAGPSGSAQLLMLSGIGPISHLEEIGVNLVQDLPVGQNLQDHISYLGLTFEMGEDVGVSIRSLLNPENIMNWITRGTGPLSSLGSVGGTAYIKTDVDTNPDPTVPDIQLLMADSSLGTDKILAKTVRVEDNFYNRFWGSMEKRASCAIYPVLVRPKSKGQLRLRSNNPKDQPRYYGNYLTDPDNHDVKTLIAGIKFVLRLAEAMRTHLNFTLKFHHTRVPYCKYMKGDEYWECAIRTLPVSLEQPVGTCAMGSVVNNKLQVLGIKNLRVADTSVVPFSMSGTYNAIGPMIGEVAADLLKLHWSSSGNTDISDTTVTTSDSSDTSDTTVTTSDSSDTSGTTVPTSRSSDTTDSTVTTSSWVDTSGTTVTTNDTTSGSINRQDISNDDNADATGGTTNDYTDTSGTTRTANENTDITSGTTETTNENTDPTSVTTRTANDNTDTTSDTTGTTNDNTSRISDITDGTTDTVTTTDTVVSVNGINSTGVTPSVTKESNDYN